MVRLTIGWGLNAVALYALNYLVPGLQLESFPAAVIAAAILAVINLVIRPLVVVLTLPVNIITLGCFTFVINAVLFALTAHLVRGFQVNGFFPALFGSLLFGLLSSILNNTLNRTEGKGK